MVLHVILDLVPIKVIMERSKYMKTTIWFTKMELAILCSKVLCHNMAFPYIYETWIVNLEISLAQQGPLIFRAILHK